jgi:hypothetical protein
LDLIGGILRGNYVHPVGGVCASGTDHRTFAETELWTQVILQAINDLDGQTSLTPGSAQDSARQWFASESDGIGSFIWTCQIINVDPSFIRSQLAKKLRMKKSGELVAISMAQGAKALRRKSSSLPDILDRTQRRPPFKRLAV